MLKCYNIVIENMQEFQPGFIFEVKVETTEL